MEVQLRTGVDVSMHEATGHEVCSNVDTFYSLTSTSTSTLLNAVILVHMQGFLVLFTGDTVSQRAPFKGLKETSIQAM